MENMFEDWVYRNLRDFHNCLIPKAKYKKYGEDEIIKDLMLHGYNCTLRIAKLEPEGKKGRRPYIVIAEENIV